MLTDAEFVVTVRTTRGDDIDAACGQLVGEVVDRTRRSERHRAERSDQNLLEPSEADLAGRHEGTAQAQHN